MKLKKIVHLRSKELAHCQKGFSLIEIVLVIFLAGFVLVLLSNLAPSLNLVGNSSKVSIAKEVAAKAIEDTRSKTYDNLANGQTTIVDSRLTSLLNPTATVTVADCPSAICTKGELLKQVTVQINWTENSKTQTVQVTTFVAKGGLN